MCRCGTLSGQTSTTQPPNTQRRDDPNWFDPTKWVYYTKYHISSESGSTRRRFDLVGVDRPAGLVDPAGEEVAEGVHLQDVVPAVARARTAGPRRRRPSRSTRRPRRSGRGRRASRGSGSRPGSASQSPRRPPRCRFVIGCGLSRKIDADRLAVDAHHPHVEVLPVDLGHRDAALDDRALRQDERGDCVQVAGSSTPPQEPASCRTAPPISASVVDPDGPVAVAVGIHDHDAGRGRAGVELHVGRPASRSGASARRAGRPSARWVAAIRHRHPGGVAASRHVAVLSNISATASGQAVGARCGRASNDFRSPRSTRRKPRYSSPGRTSSPFGMCQGPPVARRLGRVVAGAGFEQQPGDAVVLARRLQPHHRGAVERGQAVQVAVARHHVGPRDEFHVRGDAARGPEGEQFAAVRLAPLVPGLAIRT